ncbi:MAG: OmpA family protein [Bacteroidales bacterium]|nr:OmpA family protein [Bacteroidales bacterium]
MSIEIGGHTDSTGDESYNLYLSEHRAKEVYTFLLQAGISQDRISYKGYGESLNIADNSTEEGRAKKPPYRTKNIKNILDTVLP